MIGRGPVEHRVGVGKAADQIVDVGPALGGVDQEPGRAEDIAVCQVGAVGDLHHQVAVVLTINVFADPRSLGLPVQPRAQGAVVDIVMADLRVNGGVELDARDLVSVKFMLDRNIVDLVITDPAEYAAQVSRDPRLSAVVDHVVPNDVRSDPLPAPADVPGFEYRLQLVLIPRPDLETGGVVLPGGLLLADADAAALGVMNDIILNDPSPAPVGAD